MHRLTRASRSYQAVLSIKESHARMPRDVESDKAGCAIGQFQHYVGADTVNVWSFNVGCGAKRFFG
jgi:hypothetical protein